MNSLENNLDRANLKTIFSRSICVAMTKYTLPQIYHGVRRRLIRQFMPLEQKVERDAFSRPQFGYGIFQAANEAKRLGVQRISVIEFGVAGGNGLIAMEKIADEIGKHFGVTIDVYGFDTGQGQPAPADYRDVPYVWKAGQFRMDRASLQARLRQAKLVIGDVADTVGSFANGSLAPIGFISFDLDYYSSTKSAFALLKADNRYFLPRVFCYFDDIVGYPNEFHNEFAGELLAIKEFNEESPNRKITPIYGLSYKRRRPASWNIMMFVMHSFDHELYCHFINQRGDWQKPLANTH